MADALQLADALLAAATKLMAALHVQVMTENEAASDDGSTGILPATWTTALKAVNEDADAAWKAAADAMTRYAEARGLTAERIAAMARASGVRVSDAARPLTREEETAAWDGVRAQGCSCCTAAVRLFCRVNGITLAAGVKGCDSGSNEGVTEGGMKLPELDAAALAGACLTYRHDFGLLPEQQRLELMSDAAAWAHALGFPIKVGTAAAMRTCAVCGKSHSEHGSYPTCATHPYTADNTCGAVGTVNAGKSTGLPCPGSACVNGCAHGVTDLGSTEQCPPHPDAVLGVSAQVAAPKEML